MPVIDDRCRRCGGRMDVKVEEGRNLLRCPTLHYQRPIPQTPMHEIMDFRETVQRMMEASDAESGDRKAPH